MTAVEFLPMDIDAIEAGRRALHQTGDPDSASQLAWLATRMRNERFAELEQECHDIIAGRIEAYGVLGQRDTVRVEHRPHLRSVGE